MPPSARRPRRSRGKPAAGVRRAIFDLIALPPQARALLLADPYREPVDPRPIEQVLRGNLVGPVDGLTHKTQMYPCVRWSFGMADYLGEDSEGKMQFKPRDTVFTPLIGPQADFQPTSFEVRRPDPHGRTTPVAGSSERCACRTRCCRISRPSGRR